MDKVYINSEDRNVAVRKVYLKASDTYAYIDEKCETKATSDELHDAFIKGVVLIGSDKTEYLPVSCKVASDVATITYIKPNSTTATSADLVTVKSA